MYNNETLLLTKKSHILILLLVLIIFISIGGYFYYKYEENKLVEKKQAELQTIAEIKIKQISDWYIDELHDANIIAKNEFFVKLLGNWNKSNSYQDKDILKKYLSNLKEEHDFENLYLCSSDLNIIISTDNKASDFDPNLKRSIYNSILTGTTRSTDLIECTTHDKIHLAFTSPIYLANNSVYCLIFEIDVESMFNNTFTIITAQKKTAEIMIVKKVIDSAVLLNHIKDSTKIPLKFKLPLKDEQYLFVKAASGNKGIFEGYDFDGNKVLAYLNSIYGTNWNFYIKINKSELFEELHFKSTVIILFSIFLILLSAFGLAFIYSYRQRNIYQKLALTQSEFEITLNCIGDAVVAADENGLVTFLNPIAAKLTGWTFDEARGKKISEIINIKSEDTYENLSEIFNKVLKEGEIFSLANHTLLITKSGSELPILDSAAPIKNEKGIIIGIVVVFRDQTEERAKRKEQELSEEKFKKAFTISPDALIIASLINDKIMIVNHGFTQLSGYELGEIIGKSTTDLNFWFRDEDRKKFLGELSDQKIVHNFESQFRKKDSKILYGLISAAIIEIKDDKYILASIRDLTNYKQEELIKQIQFNVANAISTSNTLHEFFRIFKDELNKLVSTKNLFIAEYDEKMETFSAYFGEDEKEYIDSWPAEDSLSGIVVKQKKPLIFKKSDINKHIIDGKKLNGTLPEIWVGVPLIINQKVTGIIVIQSYDNPNAYDENTIRVLESFAPEISAYIEHKKTLITTLKLSKAVEQSQVGIVITDTNGTIEYVNPKFSQITGYDFEEAVGQNPRLLKSGYHDEEFYKVLWETITHKIEWSGEIQNKKKNGELYWEYIRISPVIDTDGKILNFIAVREDTTEKKRIIEELIQAKERAEESNKVKTNFLASMSHELRTPLVGIMGFSDILKLELTDNKFLLNYATKIKKSGERLLETLNLLLDVSRVELGKINVNLRTMNIVPILKEIYDLFEQSAKEKNLEYVFQVNPKLIYCKIDTLLFQNIFNNLVNNAIKFTEKGRVEINTEILENKVLIKVSDTGVGISPEKQNVIWEEFRQVSEGFNRSHEGNGLGLTIAKKYTEILNGKIYVDSSLGKGSTFIVELPCFENEHSEQTNISDTDNMISLQNIEIKKHKVLYVEDDESARQIVNYILRDYYDLDIVSDSDSALQSVKQNRYDIILMDINLRSGLDGVQTTQLIREIEYYKNIPIVAITAFAMDDDRHEFLSKGLSHYISKPFSREDLLELISDALKK